MWSEYTCVQTQKWLRACHDNRHLDECLATFVPTESDLNPLRFFSVDDVHGRRTQPKLRFRNGDVAGHYLWK
jgi:hypothetical protein